MRICQSIGRFSKVKNGKPYAGVVHIEIDRIENSKSPDILIKCKGTPNFSQGYIIEVPENGFDDWKNGAIVGSYVCNENYKKLSI